MANAFLASWGKDKLDVCVTLTISCDTENQLEIVNLVMPVMMTIDIFTTFGHFQP